MSGNTVQSSYIANNGPFVVGYTLCFGLMGALAVQAYIYFTRFFDDRKAIKGLVIGILLLEVLITVATFYAFWESSTVSSIDPMVTLESDYAYLISAPISGLVTTLTHGFYCWRIWIIRKSLWVPIPVMMLSLLQLISIILLDLADELGPAASALTGFLPSPLIKPEISPFFVTWLGSNVICDLTVTICMLMTLRPANLQFSNNKSMLTKLTRLTIETGLITTVAAFLELVLGFVFLDTIYHIAVFYAISKLYANCLLASLNFRLVLRSRSNPNTSLIVWDDGTVKAQVEAAHSTSSHRESHVEQLELVARGPTDEEGGVGSNEAIPTNFKLNLVLDQSSEMSQRCSSEVSR